MLIKLTERPHCRCCGKPIRKWTDNVWGYEIKKLYRSKADVQRDRNDVVTSVEYDTVTDGTTHWDYLMKLGAKVGDRLVVRFHVWDGETYEDAFFCSGTCSSRFARMVAKNHPEIATTAYRVAMHKKLVKEYVE
jgi:hypothetical protein